MKLRKLYFGAILVMGMNQLSPALTVITDTGNTVDAKPYLKAVPMPNENSIMREIKKHRSEFDNAVIVKKSEYPVKSIFRQGKVLPHKLKVSRFTSTPIFLIGSDSRSLRWLSMNKNHLKKIHAIGIITNVEDKKTVSDIEKKIGVTLLTASIDGLEKIVGTSNYPFLVVNNWVIQ